jgi:hypothetical protein
MEAALGIKLTTGDKFKRDMASKVKAPSTLTPF